MTWFDNISWIPFRNDGESEIPGFGAFMVTGSEKVGGQWVVLVKQVDDSPNPVVGFNGAMPVAVGKFGQGTFDRVAWASYDSGDGTPATGDVWGPEDGEYKLQKNFGGYKVLAVDSDNELTLVAKDFTLELLGKTDSSVSAASSGTVSIYNGATIGSESDTGSDISAYNRGDEIDADIWVNVIRRPNGWEMFPAECND